MKTKIFNRVLGMNVLLVSCLGIMGHAQGSERLLTSGTISPVNPSKGIAEKYLICDKIHSSSFSEIYTAKTADQDLPVIIKVVKKKSLFHSFEEIEKRVNSMKAIQHPNIVQYYGSFQDHKYIYIVMEYCEGITLRKYIEKQTGQLSEKEILKLFLKLVNALMFLHEKGWIHGDIKPENIILKDDGSIKLVGFNDSNVIENNDIAPTPYASPEIIIQKGKLSFWADTCSLGVLIYELMTFQQPFSDENKEQLREKIIKEKTPEITGEYSRELKVIVPMMLVKDPFERFSLKQIKKRLTSWNVDSNEKLQLMKPDFKK